MNDTKNVLLAWTSSFASFYSSREASEMLTAIVLPIVFFAAGKTADILLQIYFARRREAKKANGRREK
ncbi:MAG: hypothetical protein UZ17_ACD001001029 [Acidobacteria bacterium OLB17]|nr:MAG: hypothetical protein UZ17_ACD001001029 [Acidobacteria bacterium OLB17]MCZ2390984.1 hypothetical protein [Acidobacteriota bacterium]